MALCECGCGSDAGVYAATNRARGAVKGQPRRYINGHTRKGFRATHCLLGHPRIPENLTNLGSCRLCKPANEKRYYNKNRPKIRAKQKRFRQQNPDYDKKYGREARAEALAAYGGICACCQESQQEFLCIDHIGGGGHKHRKENNLNGSRIYFWLRKNNWPKGFRVLCHNCNMSLGFYGYCPHHPNQKEKQ